MFDWGGHYYQDTSLKLDHFFLIRNFLKNLIYLEEIGITLLYIAQPQFIDIRGARERYI